MRIGLIVILFACFSLVLSQTKIYEVYHGSNGTLAEGFLNWSWARVSLTSTEYVHTGDKYSISMVCTAWQGLYISQVNPWSIADYNTFSFWLNGGNDGNEGMTVTLTGTKNSQTLTVAEYIPSHSIPAKSWVQVKIPLDHFQAPSSEIKGFWFQANSPSGSSVAYFDDIAFTFEYVPPVNGPDLNVDASNVLATINSDIYGITIFWESSTQAQFAQFVQEVDLPLNRIGGDGTTRYNWQVDSSNSGTDWYYMGGDGDSNVTAGAMYDNFISINRKYSTKTVVTVPMIQYINKMSAWHCSYPKSVYGNQQSYNPYIHPNGDDCGNGKDTSGKDILDTHPLNHDIPNTPEIQKSWIQHLTSKWGTADRNGIIYQLDNEVSNWAFMHRDVHPQPVTYSEIVNQTLIYAKAIKQVDPKAIVAAPSEIQFAWYPDWGGLKNVIYYLQQLKEYDQKNGGRLVDSYDCHYPDANDNHWPVFTDVGKLRQTVDQTYPGTAISFSEWSLSGLGPLNGGLAVADQLGHFARYNTLFASYWGISASDLNGPICFAFRMFRNYDGKGAKFGDKYVNSTTGNDKVLSVHSAIRNSDGALTLLVINKIESDQNTHVYLKGYNPTSAQVYVYGAANENSIVSKGSISVTSSGFTYSFPSFSLTLVVLKK